MRRQGVGSRALVTRAISAPEQPDYFNCGIFPILLARCLHHGVRITRRWTREDLDEQRDLITLELLEGKLLSFTA